ncbi:MAG: DUF4340 domain-containing protein, partial [bacterium]|nr:DUF4340 domain-containing protein [bacterium]
MKLRTTLILLFIVVGLGAYVWFVDRGRPSTEERQRVAKRLLKEFDPERVTDIHVKVAQTNAVGERVVTTYHLQRDVTGWRVMAPMNFPANETAVRRMLDLARGIDREAVITGTNYLALDRRGAGLEDPDLVATFVFPATSFTLRVGEEVPGLWSHYVEFEGEDAAYYVPSHFKDNLMLAMDNSERDIRRRRVFSIRDYQVSTLSMESPSQTVELRRSDGVTWKLTQPVADAADDELMGKLLERLEKLEIASFVEQATNFGQPEFTLTVVEGMTSQRLQLGARVRGMYDTEDGPPSEYLARRIEYPQYFTVRRGDIEEFMQPADYYRSKKMILWRDDETPLELRQTVGGTTFTLTYDKGKREWSLAEVASPLVDEVKLDSYVYDWLGLKVTGFVGEAEAQMALSTAWVTVSVRFEEEPQVRVIRLSQPVNGVVYGERSPGVFVTFDEGAVRALVSTSEVRFLREELIGVKADEVREVAFMREGERVELVQRSNVWSVVKGSEVRDTTRDVTTILEAVVPVKVESYVGRAVGEELGRYGLGEGAEEVTITTLSLIH